MFLPHVPRHQQNRHLLPALLTLPPYLLPLPVGRDLFHHPSPVRHLLLVPVHLEWAAYHANYLPYIGPQSHPIKQSYQGAKCALEPSRVRRCNHTIVRVEEVILIPTLFSTLALLFCALFHHRHPVTHHCIHHHI